MISPSSWKKEAVELRTQLRTSALCVIRYESTEQSERRGSWYPRSRQCVSSGEVLREFSPKESER